MRSYSTWSAHRQRPGWFRNSLVKLSNPLAVYACLLAAIYTTFFNLAVTLHNVQLLNKLLPPAPKEYSYAGSDHPAQLPLDLPAVGLVLEYSDPHFSLWDDAEWATLFPAEGFTDLGPAQQPYLLSVVHQMHCLDIIRVGFLRNRAGDAHHVENCLRYMRQIVLCKADTTLEETGVHEIGGRNETDGSGVGMVHRCRDWTKVRQYLLDNPSHVSRA
ncbi:hypothetical protein FA95DRAFT_1492400 [Auriscalpium vulgare]|uniref:Uncharacterized protein n=1 Tax=Auriscalpium vulgare TaxID=40419 RepID=A0ACB8RU39_9AGAM|nr:hypothetical protein FA95DRAFT_1492400 [Auriscalpium vulgare]